MKKPFQTGQQVTCSYLPAGSLALAVTVRRTILAVTEVTDAHPGKVGCTGWIASADGGCPCGHCGATQQPIPLIDTDYYEVII